MITLSPVSNADLKQMRSLSLVAGPPGRELGLEDGLDLVDGLHPGLHLLPVLPSLLRVPAQTQHVRLQLLRVEPVDHHTHVILELLQQVASLFLVFADDDAHLIDGFAEHGFEVWDFWLVLEVSFELLVGLSDSALLHFSIQLYSSRNESYFQRKLNSLDPHYS